MLHYVDLLIVLISAACHNSLSLALLQAETYAALRTHDLQKQSEGRCLWQACDSSLRAFQMVLGIISFVLLSLVPFSCFRIIFDVTTRIDAE